MKHEAYKRENVYQIKKQESKSCESNPKPRVCIYCEKSGHKASECESVSSIEGRSLILARKKFCFNCTVLHFSTDTLLTTNGNIVTYLVIIVSVDGVKCGALIDRGAGASYGSSKFISLINKKPVLTETKTIQRLINSSIKDN